MELLWRIWKRAARPAAVFALLLPLSGCGLGRIPGIKFPYVLRTELPSTEKFEESYRKRHEIYGTMGRPLKAGYQERHAEYRQGYKDGCETGFAGYSTPFYKGFNSWKQDTDLVQNAKSPYYGSWRDAYAYCAMFGLMMTAHGWGNFR
jgi:hypothetical protein